MHTIRSIFRSAVPAAAFGVFLAGSACLLNAQQPTVEKSANVLIAAAGEAPALNLAASAASYSSSSSESFPDELASGRFRLASSASSIRQPPPRRRYGRPNYSDSHTNPDGSNKLAFMVGAGASIPSQDTANYLTTSYAFQAGLGRNFSNTVGVLLQFDYDHFGFTGNAIKNQQALYNSFCTPSAQQNNLCSPITNLDGTTHIWSLTLDPTFTFYGSGSTGAYFVGGVGFYHKRADFTVPSTGTYCDYYYGCYSYQANQPIDWYTSNAFGLNGGVGLTYKPSRFANERLYMEARYVWIDNSQRPASANNLYPPNANQTYYIPVTVGLRF
ncbi:MAG: hypothetical protein NVSMB62_17120 [Acidobacteriaceae bacterium]